MAIPEQFVNVLLADAAARLAGAGIPTPFNEARLLLAHATGIDRAALLRDPAAQVAPAAFNILLARRLAHEPMAYVLGHAGFWSQTLEVSPATLIPRADSETLIEAAAAACPDPAAIRTILDLGTGTGCLLLAALSLFPAAFGIAVDRIAAACTLAARNAATNGLAARTAIICADWADAIAGPIDLVLCNPPYIATAAIDALMPEVACHEPRSALDGGPDGLDVYRRLLPQLPRLLAPAGCAIIELGAGQADQVRRLAADAGLIATTRADLGGHERALLLRRQCA